MLAVDSIAEVEAYITLADARSIPKRFMLMRTASLVAKHGSAARFVLFI